MWAIALACCLTGCIDIPDPPPSLVDQLQQAQSLYPDHDITVVEYASDLEKRSKEGFLVLHANCNGYVLWRPKQATP